MEKIIIIIPIILSILAGIYLIYKNHDSEYKRYLKEYYEKILEPFYYMCILKNGRVEDFFIYSNLIANHYQVIPTYVHKLIKEGTEEAYSELYKVLYIDFINNRPSESNTYNKLSNSIIEVVGYMLYLVVPVVISIIITFSILIVVFLVVLLIVAKIMHKTMNLTLLGDIPICLLYLIVLGVTMYGIFKFCIGNIKDWTYTLNREHINQMIKGRVKRYDKIKKKVSLL